MKSQNSTILIYYYALTMSSFAQVSGTFTIGGTTPICNDSGSCNGSATAGVNGAVVLNIRPGTYHEKINIETSPVLCGKYNHHQVKTNDSSANHYSILYDK